MKQSKELVPKFILTRQGISVQIGPYISHKAVNIKDVEVI
jgi:hypothetical protein